MNPYHQSVRKPLTPQELAILWSNIEIYSMRLAHWAREQNSHNFQREFDSLQVNLRKLKAHEFAVGVEAAKSKGLTPRGKHGAGEEHSGLGSIQP